MRVARSVSTKGCLFSGSVFIYQKVIVLKMAALAAPNSAGSGPATGPGIAIGTNWTMV